MTVHRCRRVVAGALLGLAAVAAATAPRAAGAAASVTLRYYNVNQTVTATDSAGRPLANNGSGGAPAAGDHLDYTALDYTGSHVHHAPSYSASSHLACTFATGTTLTCNAQFAVGASLLLGNDVTATLASNGTSSIPINAGTGRYKHARGTITVTPIKNSVNADVVITVTQ
jgi:hypothetical protein